MTLIHKLVMILALWGLYGELEKKQTDKDTSGIWLLLLCFVILAIGR